jgi:predicted NBD/HSP70 family sugar kinase
MMLSGLDASTRIRPLLDPEFLPAAVWNRAYRRQVENSLGSQSLVLALKRLNGSVSVAHTRILPHEGEQISLNEYYVERSVKFFFWQKGGYRLTIAGPLPIAKYIQQVYSERGQRYFDQTWMGKGIYGYPLIIEHADYKDVPAPCEPVQRLGGNFDGCRIGFDLGGSDRKCAALIDGEVVHSEEVAWDPYFQKDPHWHYREIDDSISRAARRLPRIDAIGGSAAGVHVNNEVRMASIFRGVSPAALETDIRRIFKSLQAAWGSVPFVVANDGEVTALAGSMFLNQGRVLGLAMGTSLAAGYVTHAGKITDWLNELAFVPVDYRPDAPADEWSGDLGVGAQYFSQQATGRLAPKAGISLPEEMPLAEKLVEIQGLMEIGDSRAYKIYETIGAYLGYAIAQYADYYDLSNVLVLGRVLTGRGGELIVSEAERVLNQVFPEVHERVRVRTPGEQEKRLGQAVAAASLPSLR